jgi:Holliday junction resolvase
MLEEKGFWTQTSVKLKITPLIRKVTGRTDPRPEIDIVAYKGGTNELLLVECKSFLDSGGVNISAFNGKNPKFGKKFKLFTNEKYFMVIKKALVEQFCDEKKISRNPKVQRLLAAGHIAKESKEELKKLFNRRKDWELWSDDKLRQGLTNLAKKGYDNSIATMVVKLLKIQK